MVLPVSILKDVIDVIADRDILEITLKQVIATGFIRSNVVVGTICEVGVLFRTA